MIPTVILSHKRADKVLTKKAVANCLLCVPQSQADEYAEHNPELELLIHPDDIIGISPKRQWVLDKLGDCFQLDDDLNGILRVYIPKEHTYPIKLTPQEAYGLIQDTYEIAKELRCGIFGFNKSANPICYSGAKPIQHNTFINGAALGFISGRNISFPQDFLKLIGEDHYINFLNAYYNRYSYVDTRFGISAKQTNAQTGGCADFRTDEIRKQSFIYLKKCFGDCFVPKNKHKGIKENIMNYECTMNIPF